MSELVNRFNNLLNKYYDVMDGNLNSIELLTQSVQVINTETTLHYTLLENGICELDNDSSKIVDLDVNGLHDKSELDDIYYVLAFRLGKSFNNDLIEHRLNEMLSIDYSEYNKDGITFWIHKDSGINPETIEYLISFGYSIFDKMMINSLFGQVFYRRD